MITSPFLKLNKTSENKLTFILLILLLIGIIVMRFFDVHLKNEITPNGIVSFELAKNLDNSILILNSWSFDAKIFAALSLGFDFLFLIFYSTFIAILIHKLNERLWQTTSFYKFGILLIYLQFLAAFFDVIENIGLIQLLIGSLDQFWVSIAYYFASIKFIFIALGLLYIIINFCYLMIKKISK